MRIKKRSFILTPGEVNGSARVPSGSCTHIQLKGLQHRPVPSGDGGEEPQHLLDDTVQVVEAVDGVQLQGALAEAAVVEDPFAPQLFAELLQDRGVFQELHDQGGAGAGCGGVGGKDKLQGAVLKGKRRMKWMGMKGRPGRLSSPGHCGQPDHGSFGSHQHSSIHHT